MVWWPGLTRKLTKKRIVDGLTERGILKGIKTDLGWMLMPGTMGEMTTHGLGELFNWCLRLTIWLVGSDLFDLSQHQFESPHKTICMKDQFNIRKTDVFLQRSAQIHDSKSFPYPIILVAMPFENPARWFDPNWPCNKSMCWNLRTICCHQESFFIL